MLSSPLTFDRPEILLLLLVLFPAIWLARAFSSRRLPSQQLLQVTIVRSIVVTLICLAAAGIHWVSRTDRVTTIYCLDVSDSITHDEQHQALAFINSAQQKMKMGDRAGLVVFGSEPFLENPPSSSLDTSNFSVQVPSDSTNIEAALEAAAGALPQDGGKRIVLVTDGNENDGDARSTIQSLKSQNIEVDVAPVMLQGNAAPEASVVRVVTPSRSSVVAPIPVRVVLSSNVDQNATLNISRDGKPLFSENLPLNAGKSSIGFIDRIASPGFHRYTAGLTPTHDTLFQNNLGDAGVFVSGKPQVMLVRNQNEPLQSALPAALSAQGLSVTELSPADLPKTSAGYAGYDSILISDVAASDLTKLQMNAMKDANQDFGIGLGMLGGPNSFGAGGFGGSPLEAALPVKMIPKKRANTPAADVVIVLDASGSMSADENGVEKVELAARAALNLLKALQSKDRVAVLAVTETAEIVMPLVSPAEAAKYVPSIEAVSAGGGGIDCRNGLEAAYTILGTSDAAIKHVIICPDTTDSEQQEGCVALASQMYNSAGVSTSCCGIGEWTDPDVPFQRNLANAGHGQLYVANQAGNLPTFFERDVDNIEQKLYQEGNFTVSSLPGDPVAGISQSVPNMYGYNVTDAKPAATVAMRIGGSHDPLLAYWRDGLGKSLAFTSDDEAHWSTSWIKEPEYSPTWAHIVRWSLRASEDDSYQSLVTNWNGTGHIVVDAYNSQGFATNSQFVAAVAGPNGTVAHLSLSETAPGRYEATFPTKDIGDYLTQISDRANGGRQTAIISTSYSPEYAGVPPNTSLLSDLAADTGGIMLNSADDVYRRTRIWNLGTSSLVEPLLLFSAFLFLLDVAWRRFGWRLRREQAGQAREVVNATAVNMVQTVRERSSKFTNPRPIPTRTPQRIEADNDLLRRKTAAHAHDDDENDPFPFVKSLPPRQRKESQSTVSKDNQ